MKYKSVKLGDYLYIKGRIGWKGLKKDEYLIKSGYRIINGESLTINGIDWSSSGYISKERYDESPEIMLQPEDILISKDGTIGKIGYVEELSMPTTVASGIFVVRNLEKRKINTRFIYYYFCSKYFKNFIRMRTEGSVIPHLYQKDFVELYFPLPDIQVQKQIVSILSAIDEKIELNNAINKNLEEQAQAIFKSWFVDFEPFGGVMPADWKIGQILDLSEKIVCGKTPSTKKKEYYGDFMPFITIPDMHNCVYTTSTERYLSELGVKTQIKKTIPKNSICVSCIGTAGLATLVSVDSQTNQQINSIIPKKHYSPYYIYFMMKKFSEKINRLGQSGSTIVNLNKTQFGIMAVLIPSIATMIEFDNIIQPIFEKILANQRENQRLASLRDTLLPKLMNGEIDVSAVKV